VNLEGSLDAFGLADVVTLLASTGKSGGLLLRRPATTGRDEGAVWFRAGQVCGATSDRGRASLVRRLVGSGAVDDVALRQAVSLAASGGGGVAKALLDAGAVDPDLVRQAAEDQVVDAVFDLLRWTEGEFSFDPQDADPDDVGALLDPARVLAEARARVEAWPALVAVVPGPDAIVSVPTVLAQDPEVSRDEWAILSLVDGQRRVRDLVELTGAGEFAVTTTLARLVSRGLLHVKDPSAPDHVAVVERRLAMLATVERAPEQPQTALTIEEPPVLPGSGGMTAAAALAAARAAQGLPAAGTASASRGREVVPPRPEPFLPGRRPDHPEPGLPDRVVGSAYSAPGRSSTFAPGSVPEPVAGQMSVEGATVRNLAGAQPSAETLPDAVISRDPAVNRSLLLRLIAGVRGL